MKRILARFALTIWDRPNGRHGVGGQDIGQARVGLPLPSPVTTLPAPMQRLPRLIKSKVGCANLCFTCHLDVLWTFTGLCCMYSSLWAVHEAPFQCMFVMFRVVGGVISIRDRPGSGERECGPGSESETSSAAQFEEGEARSSFT